MVLHSWPISSKLEHMSDKIIRASEIAEYFYCGRAWHLRRVHGLESHNVRELESGTQYHKQHGRLLRRAVVARRLALLLLFVALSIFVYLLVRGAF
jgi:hypothetical protein